MSEPPQKPTEPKRVLQTVFEGGPRQSTLESKAGTDQTFVVVPPDEYLRRYKQEINRLRFGAPAAPVRVPNPLGERPRPVPSAGLRRIPDSVTATWSPPPGLKLREYQTTAVQRFLHARHGTILMPTGTGKTEVGIDIIYQLKVPTLILVPSHVLAAQWRSRLAQWGIRSGEYSGETQRPDFVTVALYQSLFRQPSKMREFNLIIADEGDMVSADEWSHILDQMAQHPYALLMSATLPAEPTRVARIEKQFPVVYRITLSTPLEQGHVVPAFIHPVPVPLTTTESNEYEDLQSRLIKLAQALGTSNVYQIRRLAQFAHDADTRQRAQAYLGLFTARRILLAKARNKVGEVLKIVEQHRNTRILLFGSIIDSLTEACAIISARLGPRYCRVISGEVPPQERAILLSEWGRTFWVLASAVVLGRGFNVPEVGMEIVMSGTGSQMEAVQRLGRIIRPAPGKTRADVYVIYAQNTIEDRLPALYRRAAASRELMGE